MATIVTRSGKGSPLTHAEVDANFSNLNTDKLELSGGTMTGDLSFGDNDKAIFGAGSDLQIYHDGSNSFISDESTGNLVIRGSSEVSIQDPTGSRYSARFIDTDAVRLYHNGSQKLATTSTGINVTGTATATGVSTDAITNSSGNLSISSTQSISMVFDSNNDQTNREFNLQHDSGASLIKVEESGDISFYEDTGTTAKLFWDASAESLGIGTTTPDSNTRIHIVDANTAVLRIEATGTNKYPGINLINDAQRYDFQIDGATDALRIRDATNSVDRMVITSGGDVGIGVAPSNPGWARNLHVHGAGNGGGLQLTDNTSGSGNNDGLSIASYQGNAFFINRENASMRFSTNDTERMRIDSGGDLLVGVTSMTASDTSGTGMMYANGIALRVKRESSGGGQPILDLNNTGSDDVMAMFRKDGVTVGNIGVDGGNNIYFSSGVADHGGLIFSDGGSSTPQMNPLSSGTTLANGAMNIGSSSYRFKELYLTSDISQKRTSATIINRDIDSNRTGSNQTLGRDRYFWDGTEVARVEALTGTDTSNKDDGALRIGTASAGTVSERLRISSSGDLLLGLSSTEAVGTSAGTQLRADGLVYAAATSDSHILSRRSTDGAILNFRKDTTTVGSIGTVSSSLFIASPSGSDTGLRFSNDVVHPCDMSGSPRDNAIDLGYASGRFDDIFATNGTIQTSDRNEKQDIAELTDAEQRVAVAAKGLLRKFRWRDAVTEKGDEARTHFGIIAQDLQAAFAAEGLDAGDYAMFISSTWTDEETGEERTRMGVRYSELLAFIIAAI